MSSIWSDVGRTLWKEVARDAFKRGVSTAVSESVKASIDIWKRRKIRRDQFAFSEWKKTQVEDES